MIFGRISSLLTLVIVLLHILVNVNCNKSARLEQNKYKSQASLAPASRTPNSAGLRARSRYRSERNRRRHRAGDRHVPSPPVGETVAEIERGWVHASSPSLIGFADPPR